jgi:hypothetical protein
MHLLSWMTTINAALTHPRHPTPPFKHTPKTHTQNAHTPLKHTLAPQVHSECLRLLLLVAKDVPEATLAGHLELMLAATRESRATARHRKHKYHERCAAGGVERWARAWDARAGRERVEGLGSNPPNPTDD